MQPLRFWRVTETLLQRKATDMNRCTVQSGHTPCILLILLELTHYLCEMKTKDQVAIGAFAADICPEANRASEI
jgi:hypothetical protein